MFPTKANAVCSTSKTGRNRLAKVVPIQVNTSTSGWNTAVSAGSITETNPWRMVSKMPKGERVLKMMSMIGCNVDMIAVTPPSISVATIPIRPPVTSPNRPVNTLVNPSESIEAI